MDHTSRRRQRVCVAKCFSRTTQQRRKIHLYGHFLLILFSMYFKLSYWLLNGYWLFSDATKSNEGIIYFFKYKNGEIATMKSVDATVSHSESLVDYLGKCIAWIWNGNTSYFESNIQFLYFWNKSLIVLKYFRVNFNDLK